MPESHVRVCAAHLRLLLATGLLAWGSAHAQSTEERCLIDALRRAQPETTVEAIRTQCRRAPAGAPDVVAPVPPPTKESESAATSNETAPEEARPAAPPAVANPAPALPAPAAREAAAGSRPIDDSPVRRRTADEVALWNERFALLPHRPNYIDPISHAFEAPSDAAAADAPIQRNEVKFQLSFKLPLTPPLFDGRAALFFAYTGQSWWQAYNKERSSPFREYSHEPELFVSWAPRMRVLGWDWRLASAGFVHQSNGRAGDASRSWNRLFADFRFDRPGNWWIGVRPWWRIPERDKPFPGSPLGDDNPRITHFVGDGEIRAGYAGEVHEWTVTMRRSLDRGGKGAVQIDYSRPTGFSPRLRWHAQYFDGYGESLLDYRTRLRRVSLGLMLNDWY